MKVSRNINIDKKRSKITSTFTNSKTPFFPQVANPQYNLDISFKSLNSAMMGKFHESEGPSRNEFKTTVYSEIASPIRNLKSLAPDMNSVHSWSQSENTDDINRKIVSIYKQRKEKRVKPPILKQPVPFLKVKNISSADNILRPKRTLSDTKRSVFLKHLVDLNKYEINRESQNKQSCQMAIQNLSSGSPRIFTT